MEHRAIAIGSLAGVVVTLALAPGLYGWVPRLVSPSWSATPSAALWIGAIVAVLVTLAAGGLAARWVPERPVAAGVRAGWLANAYAVVALGVPAIAVAATTGYPEAAASGDAMLEMHRAGVRLLLAVSLAAPAWLVLAAGVGGLAARIARRPPGDVPGHRPAGWALGVIALCVALLCFVPVPWSTVTDAALMYPEPAMVVAALAVPKLGLIAVAGVLTTRVARSARALASAGQPRRALAHALGLAAASLVGGGYLVRLDVSELATAAALVVAVGLGTACGLAWQAFGTAPIDVSPPPLTEVAGRAVHVGAFAGAITAITYGSAPVIGLATRLLAWPPLGDFPSEALVDAYVSCALYGGLAIVGMALLQAVPGLVGWLARRLRARFDERHAAAPVAPQRSAKP